MFEAFVGVLVGFAFGYGVREIISRRRHATAARTGISLIEYVPGKPTSTGSKLWPFRAHCLLNRMVSRSTCLALDAGNRGRI
jgi:hypothetical protein